MIKCKGLSKIYNGKKVFKNFDYSFNKKGLYIVIGSSGSGKSTLLNIIGGVDKSFIGKLGVSDSLFYLKDRNNFISSLTLKENYYLFELINNKKINYFIDIESLLKKKVNKLSLGELQLAQLVLALNCDYKIIVLDEPFSALQDHNLILCSKLVEELAKNKLVIISTHNISCFNKYTVINMDDIKSVKQREFESFDYNKKRRFENKYSLYYLKKVWFSKLLFVLSLFFTILGFFYVNKYSNDLLESFSLYDGVIIEKENSVEELNDNIFYEVCKKLAKYIVNYNANYYDSSLYNYDIKVNGYYIDNGITLSSFNYMESEMKKNEVVVGLDYHDFCKSNYIFNCNESYLKTLLINKPIEGLDLYIKDIVYEENTSFYINDRFYRVKENNEHVEYYFDVKKEDVNDVFGLVIQDELLNQLEFIRVGENNDLVRYRVERGNSSVINHFEYSNYIVCLDNGYDCLNYLNPFENLVSIDDKNDINLLLKIYDRGISLNNIVISSSLSDYLSKGIGDDISFYFEYQDMIHRVNLNVVDIIKDDSYSIYHNSEWSYKFFKDIIGFKNEDLIVKKMIVYDNLKEGYVESEDAYREIIEQINFTFEEIKKVTFILNIIVTCSSLIVLILLELFHNKFKKEYFSYLMRLNVEKKNALSIP